MLRNNNSRVHYDNIQMLPLKNSGQTGFTEEKAIRKRNGHGQTELRFASTAGVIKYL